MTTESLEDLRQRALAGYAAEAEILRILYVRFARLAKSRFKVGELAAGEIASKAATTVWEKYRKATFPNGFEKWAHRIMVNTGMNYIAKQKRHADKMEHYQSNAPLNLSGEVSKEFREALHDCLSTISSLKRKYAPILSWVYEGVEKKQICVWLNMKSRTFDTNFCRAKEILLDCLKRKEVMP